jgi:hypothetical protein
LPSARWCGRVRSAKAGRITRGEDDVTYSLDEIAKVMQTPLKLNAKAGDKIFVITDTKMDPILWQGFSKAAKEL